MPYSFSKASQSVVTIAVMDFSPISVFKWALSVKRNLEKKTPMYMYIVYILILFPSAQNARTHRHLKMFYL